MTSPFELRAQQNGYVPENASPFEQRAAELNQEGAFKSGIRTALQVPLGLAEAHPVGLWAGLMHLLGQGEVNDPEEIERIRQISEREGIPFDEEKYLQAGQQALEYFPTVANIARIAEEQTGAPLTPKTKLQKGVRLGSMAAGLQPGAMSQKAVAGVAAPAVSATAQELGLSEPFADILGLGTGAIGGAVTPAVDITAKTKPSGLKARQFEKITEPTEVSAKKMESINSKLKRDFEALSNVIIEDSPIGETAENLRNDPLYKQSTIELLNEAQNVADATPGHVSAEAYKEALKNQIGEIKGFELDEFDTNYINNINKAIENVKNENITYGELVEQYRKNNDALKEYYEPGASPALNRAKKQALLARNRAIAAVIEETHPELSKVFKEGNSRWTKIMDAEMVDDFVSDIFEGKINHRKIRDFFDKSGYKRNFTKALGKEGYQKFEKLLFDMLSTERPYKMLQVAKKSGYRRLFENLVAYMAHPGIGAAKTALDATKYAWRKLTNAMLDKPQLAVKFQSAVENVMKGNFKAAEQEMEAIRGEIEVEPKKGAEAKVGETIEVIPEEIRPEGKPIKPEAKGLPSPQKKIEYKPKEEAKTPPAEKVEPAPEAKALQQPKEKFESNYYEAEETVPQSVEMGQPKLIEYKAKEKATPEQRSQNISKNIFNDAVSGEKISEPENLEIQEYSYPAEFKKIAKTAKVPELPPTPKKKVSPTEELTEKAPKKPKPKKEKPSINDEFKPVNKKGIMIVGIDKENPTAFVTITGLNGKNKTVSYDLNSNEIKLLKSGIPQEEVIEKIYKRLEDNVNSGKINIPSNEIKYLDRKQIYFPAGTLNDYIHTPEVRSVFKDVLDYPVRFLDEKYAKLELGEKALGAYSRGEPLLISKKAIDNPNLLKIVMEEALHLLQDTKIRLKDIHKTYNLDKYKEIKQEITAKKFTKWAYEKELPHFDKNKINIEEKPYIKPSKTNKPSKSLTKEKVSELKRQDISKSGLKSQKQFILDILDDVLANPEKYEGQEKIPLDVPGDGKFKIHNDVKALKQFRKNVSSKWPDKPMRPKGSRKHVEYPEYAYKEYELKELEKREKFEAEQEKIAAENRKQAAKENAISKKHNIDNQKKMIKSIDERIRQLNDEIKSTKNKEDIKKYKDMIKVLKKKRINHENLLKEYQS